MTQPFQPTPSHWSNIQKIAFRFFCIYFLLQIAPWTWLDNTVPGIGILTGYYQMMIEWVVALFNRLWFHFPKTNIINNGSGDTSLDWENVFTFLSLALMGSIVWSVVDRKRKNYTMANYWLAVIVRYFIISMCMVYGIIKLYALQMTSPNLSQLATPLGDFLPMRFSWLFIGYSTPYQMFSGAMEVLAGLLLLYRRTIPLGILVALAVFTNVMVLNLCYDIPVKLFSIHLVVYSAYLLVNDCKRFIQFFILNKPVAANTIHFITYPKKWMRLTRIVFKLAFIIIFLVMPFYTTRERFLAQKQETASLAFQPGLYDVTSFTLMKDALPILISDTLRWKDVIFEKGGFGSVGSTDSSFRQRYHRGYFTFQTDTTLQTIGFRKFASDSLASYSFHYELIDNQTIWLRGTHKTDSLVVLLKKSHRHFQLAEKQFHWISEANR